MNNGLIASLKRTCLFFHTQQWNFWHEEEVEFSLSFGKQQDAMKDHYCYCCMNVKKSNNYIIFNGYNALMTGYIQSQCDINIFIAPSHYLLDDLLHNVQKSVTVQNRSDSLDQHFLVRVGLRSGIKKKGTPRGAWGFLVGFCNCLPNIE